MVLQLSVYFSLEEVICCWHPSGTQNHENLLQLGLNTPVFLHEYSLSRHKHTYYQIACLGYCLSFNSICVILVGAYFRNLINKDTLINVMVMNTLITAHSSSYYVCIPGHTGFTDAKC